MIAAIYARKSTDQNGVGEEEKSVARQIEHAKAYAPRRAGRSTTLMCIQTTASLVPSSRSGPDSCAC